MTHSLLIPSYSPLLKLLAVLIASMNIGEWSVLAQNGIPFNILTIKDLETNTLSEFS